jgi:hypothetical protein
MYGPLRLFATNLSIIPIYDTEKSSLSSSYVVEPEDLTAFDDDSLSTQSIAKLVVREVPPDIISQPFAVYV